MPTANPDEGLKRVIGVAGGFQQLAIMASAVILLVYLAVILATVKLRKKKMEGDEKSFKAPGGLITPSIGVVAIIEQFRQMGNSFNVDFYCIGYRYLFFYKMD